MGRTGKAVTIAALFCAAFVAAAPALGARLDPTFGRGGSYAVATPVHDGETPYTSMHLALAPGGASYVQQGSWILAFGANGKPYLGFGKRGRMLVTPKGGKLTEVGGVTVDSRGRVLVSGTLNPAGIPTAEELGIEAREVTEAFVIRYLPDGSLDPTFGNGGEVDTTFGLPTPPVAAELPGPYRRPSVMARQIAVDAQGRPVVAVVSRVSESPCVGDAGQILQAFLARLNPDGSIDTSFGGSGTGYANLEGEYTTALIPAPAGAWATVARPLCAEIGRPTLRPPGPLSSLDQGGAPLPGLDPARPPLRVGPAFAVDGQGRIVYAEERPKHEAPARVFRLLANGDPDTSFGQGGSVGLGRVGGEYVGGIAIDGKGRIVVNFSATQLAITRLAPSGRIETGFGHGGAVETKLPGTVLGQAVAIDSRGRILAAGEIWTGSLKTDKGVAIARFLPGS
ncbi:MAG TPA: hypothetical protein VHZ54_13940 [Solirubrobacterales bacterium]|jgi:uncharacterized delta-60 repeat protein|nr:hypothetical protein [Solirubrobacterales bacterium]